MKFNSRIAGVLIGIVVAVVILPIPWATPAEYQAIVAGVQALGLVVALLIAALALTGDQNDRRVDRVLQLHEDLVSGDVGAARSRLAYHLRTLGPEHEGRRYVLQPTQDQLVHDRKLHRYSDHEATTDSTPREDRVMLLRFFERADAARREKTVHLPLLHELIGSHALWWDAALWLEDHERSHRRALRDLAQWVSDYASIHQCSYVSSWARNTSRRGVNPDFLHWPPWSEHLG